MANLLGTILAGLLLLFGLISDKPTKGRMSLVERQAPFFEKASMNPANEVFSSFPAFFSFFNLNTGEPNESSVSNKANVAPQALPVENQSSELVAPEREGEEQAAPVALSVALQEKSYLEAEKTIDYFPVRNWNIPFVEISAKAVVSTDEKAEKFFYEKNSSERLPIASLTKLMTALVAFEKYSLDEKIVVSKTAVQTEGEMGGLVVGETLTVRSILYLMLMESSNDAAAALAEQISGNQFVELMNKKAAELGLNNTSFSNPIGFDGAHNYSTAFDLARLTSAALNYPLIWEMLRTQEIDIRSEPSDEQSQNRKIFNHHAVNSNKLLNVLPGIIGGKTGYTDLAGGCMIVVVQLDTFKVINVLLGANGGAPYLDRFTETEKLINWLKEAYLWKS